MTARRSSRQVPTSPVAHLAKGVVGGFVAGVAFIAVTSWFATTQGDPAMAPFKMIASLLQGQEALEAGTASVPLGMAIHSVLSVAFGLVFAAATLPVRANSLLTIGAVAWGGLLYVINFQVIARAAFPQFLTANQPFETAAHLVFGAILAVFMLRPDRKVARALIGAEEREDIRRAA